MDLFTFGLGVLTGVLVTSPTIRGKVIDWLKAAWDKITGNFK